jgi:hypothetical protein
MTEERQTATEPVPSPKERWTARLGAPEQVATLREALRTLPPRWISDGYKAFFRSRDEAQSFRLVRLPFRKITHMAVLDALPKLHDHRPEIIRHLSELFVARHEHTLNDLLVGGVPEGVGADTLPVLYWLVEEEWGPEQRAQSLASMTASLVTVRAALAEEEQRHHQSQEQLVVMQKDLNTARQRLNDVQAQHEMELSAIRQAHEAYRAAAARQQRQWAHAVQVIRDDQSAAASELQELRAQVTQLKAQPPAPTMDVEALHQALILDYEQCGTTPTQRLLGLFQAYRAFLEGQADEHLERASNLTALGGEAPSGLLLLGLERLLEDGAGLPLARYLGSRVFQQEAILHRLIDPVESPRLRDPA